MTHNEEYKNYFKRKAKAPTKGKQLLSSVIRKFCPDKEIYFGS